MTSFRVGQKVVCIDACNGLKEGNVYTVSRVGVGLSGCPMVDVAESGGWSDHTPAFYSKRFRPVVEHKTSIEIFKAMLNKPSVRIDA